jgi:actin-related protein 6
MTVPGRRCHVGGKIMTNHLKEVVSYRCVRGRIARRGAGRRLTGRAGPRQWNMMDETYIMNHVKEQCTFVSDEPLRDLRRAR